MESGDASNFSQLSSDFILLPSQDEPQQEEGIDDQMRQALRNLPALQAPRPPERPVVATSMLSDLAGTTSPEDENKKRCTSDVLVTDTEMEPTCTDQEQTDVNISESVEESEENDNAADVTVIEKKTKKRLKDDSDIIADTEVSTTCPATPVEPDKSGQEAGLQGQESKSQGSRSQSSSQNESSSQSKDRSNLGSYDQCEVYGTQTRGHAHGQRFPLVQSSQVDVFGDSDDGDDYVSTPAEHIGSLQLSAKPMLVPETVEQTESEVPITPPHIIPASPTEQEISDEEPLYNINDANTLADHSKGFNYSNSSGGSSGSRGTGDRTVVERQELDQQQQLGQVIPTEDQEFVMHPGPTLAGDVLPEQQEDEESLHLHLSASHPSDASCLQQMSPEAHSRSLMSPEAHSRSLMSPEAHSRSLEIIEDVIVIDSSTGHTVEREEEAQLSLHLSPSQGEMTLNRTPSAKSSTKGKKSHHHKRHSERSHHNKRHVENEKPIVIWESNELMEVEEESVKDTGNSKVLEKIKLGEPVKEIQATVGTSKSSSGDRLSDDFHLTLPKGGDLLHPAVSEKAVAMEMDKNKPDQTEPPLEDVSENISVEIIDRPKSPTLTMSMIHADSEMTASEHVFRLERPEVHPSNIELSEENQQDDIFRRAKVKSPRKHWKYIQDDDSDEEYISSKQPQVVTMATASETMKDKQTTADHRENPAVSQLQVVRPLEDSIESADSTVPYDADAVPKSSKVLDNNKPSLTKQGTEMEVLEAIPITLVSQKSPLIVDVEAPYSEVEKSTADHTMSAIELQSSEVMRPPSTPVISQQDRQTLVDRPKTPASVQNILKAYSDIIHKTTPLRQRSASVDVTQQHSEPKTSMLHQLSHDILQSGSTSLSQTKEQSQKVSQLKIQIHPSILNGASVSKGSSSPKGGSGSPKGGSWISARKPSTESNPDTEKTQLKSGSVSPNSNPPKSPKGLDISEISHELLQSFRQSKKNRHHSENSVNGKHNGNGHHGTNKVQDNGNGNHDNQKYNNGQNTQKSNGWVQNGAGSHGDPKTSHVTDIDKQAKNETNKTHVHSQNIANSKNVSHNVSKTLMLTGPTLHQNSLSSPQSKQMPSALKPADNSSISNVMSVRPRTENQCLLSASGSQGQDQSQKRTPLPEASSVISVRKSASFVSVAEKPSSRKKEKIWPKNKKLITAAERQRLRASVDSSTSAKTTGSFVSSTQKFLHKETSIEPMSTQSENQSLDPFTFQGSQSQRETRSAPRLRKYTSSSFERSPVSSRKRRKTVLRKSGVKKQKVTDNAGNPDHVTVINPGSGKEVGSSTSHSSDPTVTTVGSLQSIPSSISHASPVGEPIVSPSSSGSGRTSTGRGTSTRRLSLEPLPDTVPLQSEDEHYQQMLEETKVTKFYTMGTKTERKLIGPQGQVVEESTKVAHGDPVILMETTQKKVQLIYVPSPSRSVSSLTSGDLADVSSSLSRSTSSSLGSKVSITGSFDQSQKSPDQSQPSQRRLERSRSDVEKGQGQKELGTSQTDKRTPEFLEPQPSTSKQIPEMRKKDTSKPSTPDFPFKPPSTGVTPLIPSNIVIPSDTDGSDVGTPLGSTINKTGSYLHGRTISEESPRPVVGLKSKNTSPKASDSLFSSAEEKGDNHEGVQTRRQSSDTSDSIIIPAGQKRLTPAEPAATETSLTKTTSGEALLSTDEISPEIPYQDQAISSSGENTALVPSSGEPGSRVIAKWKDGYYYPGTVKGKDRYGRFQVRFDDGDSMTVKTTEVMLVEKLPVGQSVLVQKDDGYFESGMIIQQNEEKYMVETDGGSKGLYSQSQVILSEDQASCLIADRRSEIMIELPGQPQHPVNVGDVSLENLLDAPRRSAKKVVPEPKVKDEDRGQGQGSGRGRKRKLGPQATSTPTPKASPKKRKTTTPAGLVESPQVGAVPSRKSPRKARVGLFTQDLGPIQTKKLFRGMTFLITNVVKTAEQKKMIKELLHDSSLETSTDESATEQEVTVPFDKSHLKAQIEAGGGKVLDNFDAEVIEASKKCYLISSTYQRTIKYIQCLACGVICVAHNWIINSCKEEKLLDHKDYILPAGISLEKKKVLEWKPRHDVLIGIKAFVVSKDSQFCDCWREILKLAKCNVLPKLQYSELDVIVTDSTCSQVTLRQAETHGVAVVSTEWVIQSLVNGRAMKYDGHPKYKHDFTV